MKAFKQYCEKYPLITEEVNGREFSYRHCMPNPTTITDLKGGHLALMVNCDRYVKTIVEYINERISK